MRGQEVCASHGGRAPQNRRAAERRLAGEEIRDRLGVPLEIDPLDAVIAAVHEAAGNVAYLRGLVGDDENRGRFITPLGMSVVVELYNEERDRLARYSKLALDAGIDERRLRVDEGRIVALGAAVDAAITDVGLDPEQREALRAALGRQLRARLGAAG